MDHGPGRLGTANARVAGNGRISAIVSVRLLDRKVNHMFE
jgi:hypothetical protein